MVSRRRVPSLAKALELIWRWPERSALRLVPSPGIAITRVAVPRIAVPRVAVPRIAVPRIVVPRIVIPRIAVPGIAVLRIAGGCNVEKRLRDFCSNLRDAREKRSGDHPHKQSVLNQVLPLAPPHERTKPLNYQHAYSMEIGKRVCRAQPMRTVRETAAAYLLPRSSHNMRGSTISTVITRTPRPLSSRARCKAGTASHLDRAGLPRGVCRKGADD